MTSKYDVYWQEKMPEIARLLKEAYENGASSEIDVSDIEAHGHRKSWYGYVEVSVSGILKSSGAHARSLGRLVHSNHLLQPYGETVFRIAISKNHKLAVRRFSTYDPEAAIAVNKAEQEPSAMEQAIREYQEKRPLYQLFTTKLHALIEELLMSRGVRYSVVESRCKTVESFSEKLGRSGKRYSDPVSEITDLCGIRVIVYYVDDLRLVGDLVAQEFDVDESSSGDKRDTLKANEFGYTSVHYVVSLSSARGPLPEWRAYAGLKAEIQVRTVLQHAWASMSHAIDYKQELDAPTQLRRRLFRLSALLELADEQFSDLRAARETNITQVREDLERGDADLEINLDTVREFLATSWLVAAIVALGQSAGFMFVDIKDDEFLSNFVAHCHALQIGTIGEIEELLHTPGERYGHYLSEMLRISKEEGKSLWWAERSFLVLLVLLYAKRDIVNIEMLTGLGCAENIASMVLTAIERTSAKVPPS